MENQLNFEELYNQAQQEIANLQHAIRVMQGELRKAQEGEAKEEDKKK